MRLTAMRRHTVFKQYYVFLCIRSVGWLKTFLWGLFISTSGFLTSNIMPGGLFDKENVVGRYGYHISGIGLSLTYDTRNNAFCAG